LRAEDKLASESEDASEVYPENSILSHDHTNCPLNIVYSKWNLFICVLTDVKIQKCGQSTFLCFCCNLGKAWAVPLWSVAGRTRTGVKKPARL